MYLAQSRIAKTVHAVRFAIRATGYCPMPIFIVGMFGKESEHQVRQELRRRIDRVGVVGVDLVRELEGPVGRQLQEHPQDVHRLATRDPKPVLLERDEPLLLHDAVFWLPLLWAQRSRVSWMKLSLGKSGCAS